MYKFLICFFLSVPVMAQVKLPALISDNMVLQQKSTVTLWGWAKPGEMVKVRYSWAKVGFTTRADAQGKWAVKVTTPKAGGPYTLYFNEIEIKNVLLGEVWLASGQSNMEFVMTRQNNNYTGVLNYAEEIAAANYPMIRMIDVKNTVGQQPAEDFSGVWKVCSPETVDSMSAVAYYFAKEVHRETGLPVGIINSTWGGTPAESWTKQEVLEKDVDFKVIMNRFRQQCEEFPAAMEKHKLVLEKWKADTSSKKGGAPREPMGPNNSKGPYKLYNGMIAPLVNYSLKGVIWYQGESNSERAYQYRRLFPAMINSWRKDWNNEDLPFYFVQITPHRGQSPEIRDAQLYTYRTVKHTGIVVTTDYGDSLDIHPRNKKTVGERLSRWALKNEYGKKVITSGPLYTTYKIEGNKIRISFDHAEGLQAKGGPLREFMIAGKDEQFIPAQAKVEGKTIVVWSDTLKQPVAVRFAWKNFPQPNLFNNEGLPASPFKTDSWKQVSEGKN